MNMLGMTSMPHRIGGYIIPTVSYDNENIVITLNIPSNSRIMCNNCTLENENILISNGYIEKVMNGYIIKNNISKLKIIRTISDKSPLSILKGREILYCDNKETGDNIIFNLPKGFRVNKVICENNGENTFPISNNYIIEY